MVRGDRVPVNRLPSGWNLARFNEFLGRIEGREITIDDSQNYNCVGVRWYGCGAFIRERPLGLDISRKQQWVIKNGDVVYNKLFAWKGAFAVADETVDGCIVSDKFPLYRINEEMVYPAYIRHFFRAPEIATQAGLLSNGAAALRKLPLDPPQFWDLTIPLPPIEEQRRIVERIERLSQEIRDAKCLVDE